MPTNRMAALQLRGRAGTLSGHVYWPGPLGSGRARLLMFCSLADDDAWCQRLSTSAELMVVSVTCDAGSCDAIDSAEWIAENTARLGGDPDHLLIGGVGAGGALAAGVAVHAHASGWPQISRQVLICASPVPAPLPGVAPATVVTIDNDPRGDGGRYAAQLRDAGVQVDELRYTAPDPESAAHIRDGRLLLADLAAALRSHADRKDI